MSSGRSSRGSLAWLRALLTNGYFWGGLLVLFGIGLGTFFLVDGVIMPSYTRHGVSTTVPNVKDLPFTKAQTRLQEQNLKVKRQVGRYNPNVDTGLVVDQTPLAASKVKPGRRVYLTVNSGEVPTVRIPDLSGMSVREAKNRISSVGLEIGKIREDSIPSPYANTITKQTPAPGDTLQEGKTVDLWYSTGLGSTSVEVPNVVGLRVKEAQRFLLQSELRSVVVDTTASAESEPPPSSSAHPSPDSLFVRRQAHAPGDSVQAGTEIRLYTTPDAQKAAKLRQQAAQDSTSASES